MSDKLLHVGAKLASGTLLMRLYRKAENQQSISATALENELDRISDQMRLDAITITNERKRYIRRLQKKESKRDHLPELAEKILQNHEEIAVIIGDLELSNSAKAIRIEELEKDNAELREYLTTIVEADDDEELDSFAKAVKLVELNHKGERG